MTDVLQLLTDKATLMGYHPIVADANSIQYELSNASLEDGRTFIYFTLPTFTRGLSMQTYNGDLTYSIKIMVGRKMEAETISSISETAAQKYDNRLFELSSILNAFLTSFFCSNEIEEISSSIVMDTNIFSTNCDGVFSNTVMRLWNQ
jgi:hypothetical protein